MESIKIKPGKSLKPQNLENQARQACQDSEAKLSCMAAKMSKRFGKHLNPLASTKSIKITPGKPPKPQNLENQLWEASQAAEAHLSGRTAKMSQRSEKHFKTH